MAYNQQNMFWDWVRTQQGEQGDHSGEGVDHAAQPVPGAWPGGLFGSSFGQWPFPPPPPPPNHAGPHPPPPHHGPGHHGHHRPPPPPEFGVGFPFGECWFGGPPRGGWRGRGGRRGRHCGRGGRQSDTDRGEGQAFDLSGLLASLASHPLARPYRQFFDNLAAQAQGEGQQFGEVAREEEGEEDSTNTFIPPIDVFTTPIEYVLHIALPGAKKEDVGINWDADKGVLNVAGVIYRQGDEEFLKLLTKSERKVGVFERAVKLPPVGEDDEQEKEEIDGDGITAKLEDGVLVVRVPKVEREWTDVKKVDIQ